GSHETFQCQPVDQNIDSFGSDQIQTPQYPHAQPDDTNELFQKLLEYLQIIKEELLEYINSPSWNYPTFCDDDEKNSVQYKEYLEKSPDAITPILPTEEPEYSLSMGYEHLSTTPETEFDEVTESSAKNLVPIPSEYEVTSDDESECDVPDKDDSSPVFTTFSNPLFDYNDDFTSSDDESLPDKDLLIEEFKVYSNPLFDDGEINFDKLDPHCFNAESDLIESLLNQDTLFDSSPKFDFLLKEFSGELAHITPILQGIKEADFDLEEEIRVGALNDLHNWYQSHVALDIGSTMCFNLIQAVAATDDSLAVSEHTTIETPMNMSPENKAHLKSEKEAIHLILTGIRDEIYSIVDACQTAQEMWEAIERLQQGESLNIQDFRNQRMMNVVGARENIGSPVVQQSEIQCFNCKEFGHFAKECRKPKRVRDSAYHKEKMLLYKQAEKGVNHKTNISRPQQRSNQMKDKVVPNNSQVKLKKTQVEDHPRIPSISNKIKSVTSCNDSLNSRSSNDNAIFVTCGKCLVDSDHFTCVTKMLNDVNARTKKSNVVPISTRRPKGNATKSVATPHKKKVASKSTTQKPKSYDRMLYEKTSKAWKWLIEQQFLSGYKWVPKTKIQWIPKARNDNVQKRIVQLILFIIDSGCTKHMTGNLKLLCNFVEKYLGFITSKASITISSQLVNFVMRIWRLLSENLHVLLEIFRVTIFSPDLVIGLQKLKYVKDQLCSSCEVSKAKRRSFKSKVVSSLKGRLNLLHMDLCGPMRVASINGKKYILVIVDDYLRYTWTLFLRSKDETPKVFKEFLTMIQRNLQAPMITIQTDRGTKFLNKTLHAFFKEEELSIKFLLLEHLNRTVLSKDETVLWLRLLEQCSQL
nr:hypothetical protein [Tanacetum cinerariifolium]